MTRKRYAEWAKYLGWVAGYDAFPHGRKPEHWCDTEYAKGWRSAADEAQRAMKREEEDEAHKDELRKLSDMLEELGFEIPKPVED